VAIWYFEFKMNIAFILPILWVKRIGCSPGQESLKEAIEMGADSTGMGFRTGRIVV
jgi:hypothetical protein